MLSDAVLLKTAMRLLVEERFSVNLLLKEVSVRPKTLYHRLRIYCMMLGQPQKKPNAHNVLVDYIINAGWKQLVHLLGEAEEKATNPLERLEEVVEQITNFFCENKELFFIMSQYRPSWANERVLRAPTAFRSMFLTMLQLNVRDAREKGLLTKDVNPDLLSRLLVGSIEGALSGLLIRQDRLEQYKKGDLKKGFSVLLRALR